MCLAMTKITSLLSMLLLLLAATQTCHLCPQPEMLWKKHSISNQKAPIVFRNYSLQMSPVCTPSNVKLVLATVIMLWDWEMVSGINHKLTLCLLKFGYK